MIVAGHVQALTAAEPNVCREVQRFKGALRKLAKEKLKSEVVFFERNYRTQHAQVNAVPVSTHKSMELKETFEKAAMKKVSTLLLNAQ